MPATPATLAALQRLLEGSSLLGAEVDLTFRVLALTIEEPAPVAGQKDEAAPASEDRRRQVLLHPASSIVGCLRVVGDPVMVESFDVAQLPDVVAALGAPTLAGQMVGSAMPGSDDWPTPSFQGRSSAPDGHRHRILLEVAGSSRRLGLHVTFDDVEIRTPDGQPIALG